MSWTLIIATSILLNVSLMAAGFSFISASVTFFVTIFYAFCWARTWGLSGLWASSGFYVAPAFYKWIWPVPPTPIDRDWSLSMGFGILPVTNVPYAGWQHPLMSTMASSRLASLTKTSQKNVFKIAIVVSLITPIFAILTWLGMLYTWGLTRSLTFRGGVHNPVEEYREAFVEPLPATGIWWPQAIAGLITAVALSYMHARFVWFPFEPIGMLVEISAWNMQQGLWQTAGIAWILKVLTIRIGGSKTYEKHGQPVDSGFFIGYALAVLIVGVIGIYRFYFPF